MKPDLIMVLSGEDPQARHRSKKAIEIYQAYDGEAPILVSGSHSGLLGRELPSGMARECHQSQEFLISQGVPERDVTCEEASLCTLGNFYFSQPLIKENQQSVYVVTDPFHMKRSMWCSRVIFGLEKEFTAQETANDSNSPYKKAIESLQMALLGRDFRNRGIEAGDSEAMRDFFENAHPFYCAGSPEKTWYGIFIRLFQGNIRLAKALLPTQAQAYKELD